MPSRFQIREAVVKFLYGADLEGEIAPAVMRGPSWDFVTESDCRRLQVETFRNVKHLVFFEHKREDRLLEFVKRQTLAIARLSAWPQADNLLSGLKRIAELESDWSTCFAKLESLPKDDDDASVEERFGDALAVFFKLDHELAAARSRFLHDMEDFPALRSQLEPVAATIRRLQRISELLLMVEEPEKFPQQANLARLRYTKAKINKLRQKADELVDAIIAKSEPIDESLTAVIENFTSERIDTVDRAILRLGTYEIFYAATPPQVAINEAIQLAKRYGTTDSPRFVNGVLDRVAKRREGGSASQGVL